MPGLFALARTIPAVQQAIDAVVVVGLVGQCVSQFGQPFEQFLVAGRRHIRNPPTGKALQLQQQFPL